MFQGAFDLASPHAVANDNKLPDPPDGLGEDAVRRAFLNEQFRSGEPPLPELNELAAELEPDVDPEPKR